jgi:hypothetical protein
MNQPAVARSVQKLSREDLNRPIVVRYKSMPQIRDGAVLYVMQHVSME